MSGYDSDRLRSGLSEAREWVDAGLSRLPFLSEAASRLPAQSAYSLNAGGKRIRPFLVMRACLAGGHSLDRALPAACAVEMIHTYSLIHDDLPALDDDDLRRGQPTLHTIVGVPQAVLAGDLLLAEAFRELGRTPLGPGAVSKMLGLLAGAAGPAFLVGGQYMDLNHPEEPGMDWIESMIEGKTSAMIRVSLELGAVAGGFDDGALPGVSSAGGKLGYLFQLTDDILDLTGTETEMGKGVSKDGWRDKANPVSAMGLEAAAGIAGDLALETAGLFEALPGDWEMVSMLARYLPGRRS
jgi:geranylgeranyl diphosphate synthase type II